MPNDKINQVLRDRKIKSKVFLTQNEKLLTIVNNELLNTINKFKINNKMFQNNFREIRPISGN